MINLNINSIILTIYQFIYHFLVYFSNLITFFLVKIIICLFYTCQSI